MDSARAPIVEVDKIDQDKEENDIPQQKDKDVS